MRFGLVAGADCLDWDTRNNLVILLPADGQIHLGEAAVGRIALGCFCKV